MRNTDSLFIVTDLDGVIQVMRSGASSWGSEGSAKKALHNDINYYRVAWWSEPDEEALARGVPLYMSDEKWHIRSLGEEQVFDTRPAAVRWVMEREYKIVEITKVNFHANTN